MLWQIHANSSYLWLRRLLFVHPWYVIDAHRLAHQIMLGLRHCIEEDKENTRLIQKQTALNYLKLH